VEVRVIFDLSSQFVRCALPVFVGIVFTMISHLDRFNDRAIRPIPVAQSEYGTKISKSSEKWLFPNNLAIKS
jgi:hypothetical protein